MKKKKLVFKELIEDIKSRDKRGWEIYKKPMTTFDGRNSLQDAYEEALDLVVYLKKFLLEQDNLLKIIDQIAKENYKLGFIDGSDTTGIQADEIWICKIEELKEKIKGMKKEIYNEKEVGKSGTHAIASNQNYGFNEAIDKVIQLLDDLQQSQSIKGQKNK
jgi:hypothetical protein